MTKSVSEFKFPFPLFVTWYQLFIALLLLIFFGELGKRYPNIIEKTQDLSLYVSNLNSNISSNFFYF